MPHKRSTPPPRSVRGVRRGPSPTWSVLLQRGLRARQAGEWQEVGRLLPLLATAPDGPPADPPSRDVQAWGMLQAVLSELDADFAGYADRHFARLAAGAADPRLEGWLRDAAA